MNTGVAVTGLGAVTGFGSRVADFWQGLCAGETTVRPVPVALFDIAAHRTTLASVVDVEREIELGRADRFAVRAAEEALAQAFGDAPLPIVGVFFGSSTGALLETEDVFERVLGNEVLRVRELASQQHNGPGDAVARRIGASGPVMSLSSACASSSMAIGAALDALRSGEIEVAVVGGSDELCQLTYAGFNSLRAVDARPTRPYRADRDGLSLGEGAGVLVLETEEHAERRGATPIGYLVGAAATCDAHHMSAPLADGSGAADAMSRAIADACITPDRIDFLNVHGTGTPQNDAAEWQAIQRVFGERARELPLVATKGAIGHLLGASGAIEAVATVLSLIHARLPGAPGGGEVDPACPGRLVLGPPMDLPRAKFGMSTNLAFGGANTALVFAGTEAEG